MTEKELILRIKAAADAGSFGKVKDHIGKLGGVATNAGKMIAGGMLAGGVAIAGLGAAAIHSAGQFQTQMKQVETLGADFGRPFAEVERDVSKLATTMGIDATDAATTLYNAVSAGVPAGNALEFMEAAAKAAVGGAADLSAVGGAMGVVMNSWGEQAGDATAITDKLFQTVKMGVTTMPELASAIGGVSGIAGAAGVSFDETAAAIAQITTKGKTTSVAVTGLKSIIAEMVTPTSKASKALAELGFESASAALEQEGFQGVLQLLEGHAAAAGVPVTALFGSVEAGGAILDMVGDNTQAFTDKLSGMDTAAGNSQAALDKVNEGWEQQVKLLQGQVSGALRDIGMAAMPAVTGALRDHLIPAVAEGGRRLTDFVGALSTLGDDAATTGDRMALAGEGARTFGDRAADALSTLTGFDLSGWAGTIDNLRQRWEDVKAAFDDDGIIAALSEIVGFDLQPIVDGFVAVGDAVVATGAFLLEHKGLVLATAAAFVVFKGALAINQAIATLGAALTATKAAWAAYRSGVALSTVATQLFGTSMKVAMGPVGWIIMALAAGVALLYAAWKTNFGGIQDKTRAVIEWLKGVPDMVAAGWRALVAGVANLVQEWRAKWDGLSGQTKTAIKALLMLFFPIPMLFTKTGRDMIQGLWNGMKAIWASVTGWMKKQAQALVDTAKSVFKVRSPSQVFFSIGRWLMEGLALGIGAGGVLARDAMDAALAKLRDLIDSGKIEAARAAVHDLGVQIMDLRMAFLQGGKAEPGSLAWLMGQWDQPPDFGAVFASLNIPVDGIDAFAALLTRLASEGEVEQVADLWGRFYDSMIEQENAYHAAQMRRIEAGAEAAKTAHEAAQKAMTEAMELEKRHFDWVKDQEAQAAQQPGGRPVGQKTKFFSDDVDRIKEKMADALAFIGFEGPKALADFWKAYVGDANASITTTEDLSKAIDAIISEVGKRWTEAAEKLDKQWADTAASEKDRHDATIKMLDEQAKFIDTLIASQSLAQEQLNALIAERERLLAAAREAIKAAQDAEEEREDRIHDGVMANIDAQRDAWTKAHNARMTALEAERKRHEDFHNDIIAGLQARRDAIDVDLKAREQVIDNMRADLLQLKLDLGVDAAVAELIILKEALGEVKRVMDSFEVQPIGRADLDRQRKAQTERVRATTDEQRAMLEKARDSGLLSTDQLRTVQMLLLGYKQRATDVADIFKVIETTLEDQVKAQQAVVDNNQLQIEAAEAAITAAETLLSIDKTRAQTQIQDIERRIKAEDERWRLEKARLDAGIAAEEARYKAEMDFLDEVERRERDRHAQRMSDIAGEYALMLASLGMSQAEIDGIIAAAQALAQSIADETRALFDRIIQDAPLPVAPPSAQPPGPPDMVKARRRGLPPPPGGGQGGGGIGGPGNAIVIDGGATITEGTIESVMLGGMTMEGTHVTVLLPSGRELTAEIIDEAIGNVTILDKLGKALNERAGRTP